MFNFQSNGLGVQSLTMYLMSSTGLLPRFDVSIFVDTGKEKSKTYEILDWLIKWQKTNNGIPLSIVKEKNLFNDLQSNNSRFAPIPAFTLNGSGMLRRQCTNEYKIRQIKKRVKLILGLSATSHFPPCGNWIGFSLDEVERISLSDSDWETKYFPFCNAFSSRYKVTLQKDSYFPAHGITRLNCENWLLSHNFPNPGKSSCVFCPYLSNYEWQQMKIGDPASFQSAILIDSAIRNKKKQGVKEQLYIHKSCKPLGSIAFDNNQPSIFNCTSGVCHI